MKTYRYDHSAGAAAVSVQCLACHRMVRLADALIDPEGPSFKAYFHPSCVRSVRIEPCQHDGCAREHATSVDDQGKPHN